MRVGATAGCLVFALTFAGGWFGGGFDQPLRDVAAQVGVAAVAYVATAIVVASLVLRLRPDMPDGKVRITTGVNVFFLVPALFILFIVLYAAMGGIVDD